MRRAFRGRVRDSGSVAVEAAILAPAVVVLVMIVVVVGRIQTTGGVVDAAARAGARAASLARTPEAARQAAEDAVREVFTRQRVPCTEEKIQSFEDVPPEDGPAGLGTVSLTVTCEVPLGQLAVDGLPGTKTLTGSFTSVIDRYRSTTG